LEKIFKAILKNIESDANMRENDLRIIEKDVN
jgi:hypothetical protein